ncbi:MAG: rhomboid family intramembrane serine protease [Acidobacteria bacterium]|nr:rhomboid family intramembrane serine protease [Acidobacteriota bacterium]
MAYRSYRSTVSFGFGYGITPAVKKLLIANIAAFVVSVLAQAAGYGSAARWLMLTPLAVIHGAVWQLVTYLFLHGGFFHILFNMLALWMFGSDLERTWGTRRFLFYYFLTGIGAGLTVLLLNPTSMVATLGASGAIYGILLAFGLLFPNRPIFIWFVFPIPAKYFVMIFGGMEFLSALSMPGDTISHVAHLGGLVVGFLYLRGRPYYFDFRNRYYRWRRQRLQRQFRVYMNKHLRKRQGPDRWVN